ncbi:MAG: Jag N-terminal domain-containing protein [Spirochaetes bacterium]|nr:Jag N-terminal domain-containing protein [Spirochaetota bacterium]
MDGQLIFEGKNLDEALEKASNELKINKNIIRYKVIEKKKSIFGEKILIAIENLNNLENLEDKIYNFVQEFFNLYFSFLEINGKVEKPIFENNYAIIKITTNNDNLFLTNQAEVLLSAQKILNTIGKNYIGVEPRIVLDCKDYRKKRSIILEKIALEKAEEVKKFKKVFVFKPLEPYERKIIHMTLQNHPDVYTESEGTNFYKKLKIIPKTK